MLSPSIQSLIEKEAGSFIIPAPRIAFVEDEDPLYHAFSILTKTEYSKISVLDRNQEIVGLISLAMTTDKILMPDNIVTESLSDLKVKDVMQIDFEAINSVHTNLEAQLHLLVGNPFVSVMNNNNIFQGLLTRREWIKVFNYVTHLVDDRHNIIKKSKLSKIN